MTADRLRLAASKLREQVASATTKTVRMPMVRGVHINQAHYLTTTPEACAALADWLDIHADYEDTGENARDEFLAALATANAILGGTS